MLTLGQTLQVVKNTKDYHAALVRNGYRVPELKSPLCTKEFLMQVRSGEVYVPKIVDLKLSPCPEPPTIQIIQKELIRVIETGLPNVDQTLQPRFAKFLTHLRYRAGDKSFMLDYLSTICERDHPFFAKDYRPPKRQSQFVFEELKVDNSDDFFTGLPISTSKTKRKGAGMSTVLNPQQIEQYKLAKLQHKSDEIAAKLNRQKSKINQMIGNNQNLAPNQQVNRQISQRDQQINLADVAEMIQIGQLHQQLERMNMTRGDSEDNDQQSPVSRRNDLTFEFTTEQVNLSQLIQHNDSGEINQPNFITTRY